MGTTGFEPATGRCACGAVAYRVDGAATALYHCHCSVCRRLHGALFATYACVQREHVTVEAGTGSLSTYRSDLAKWQFCRVCGCHLFAEHEHNPGMAWYMPATLDGDLTPGHPRGSEKHIFVGSKSPLARIPDDAPRFEGHAPGEEGAASS
ncbi:MAG: GFA family protein [Immundisolibacterales bacterium]|nr:GFA family protein [Immundisolibacterales bacterium]